MDRDPFIQAENDNRSAQVIQIESSRVLPLLVVLSAISGLAVAIAYAALNRARDAETEARMLEYYVLEMDAKLIAAGFKTDSESVAKRLKEK